MSSMLAISLPLGERLQASRSSLSHWERDCKHRGHMFLLRFCYVSRVKATILAPPHPSRDSPSSPSALGLSPRLRLRPPSGRPWPWPSWLARRSAAGVTATILAPQNPSRDSPSSPLALGMSPQLRLRSPSRPQSQSLGLTCCSWRCERQPTAGLSMRLA